MNLPMRIDKDILGGFMDARLLDIRQHIEQHSEGFPEFVTGAERQYAILAELPVEYQHQIDDLLLAIEMQHYTLQLACYLQGLADGGLSLSQLSSSVTL